MHAGGLRRAGGALLVAALLMQTATMRTVWIESDVPSFGFPVPAWPWCGYTSLRWRVDLAPLLIDLVATAAVVGVPVVTVAERCVAGRSGWGRVASGGMVAALLWRGGFAWADVDVRWWPEQTERAECRTWWFGAGDQRLDAQERARVCVE